MLRTRPGITRIKYGSFTQGTIFSCASAPRYTDCEVFGLAITARCEFAQTKYPVLNYVPIVKLNDWLAREGLDILTEQHLNDEIGNQKARLRKSGLSDDIYDCATIEDIIAAHFIEPHNKAVKQTVYELRSTATALDHFNSLLQNGDTASIRDLLRTRHPYKISELIRRLSRHAVTGYYFLETVSPDEDTCIGYVCLLREIATLPSTVAKALSIGLDSTLLRSLTEHDTTCHLTIPPSELAMPVSQLTSPTIEHILQTFTQLFGRIGIADPDKQLIQSIIEFHL